MVYSDTINLPSNNHHGLLLYKNNDQRNEILINLLNKELAKGHICIYAPVDLYNSENNSSISAISSKILNYHENIQNGNLQIINMRHYYESAIRREMRAFNNIKAGLQKVIRSRRRYDYGKTRKEILIITDINFSLLQNKYVGQCFAVEEWLCNVHSEYVQNNQYVTILCLYPNFLLSSNLDGSLKLIRDKLVELHSITIDVTVGSSNLSKY